MYKVFFTLLLSLFLWANPAAAWEENTDNLWDVIRSDFQLGKNAQDPAVQAEIEWFIQHRKIFNKMALGAVPYLYYIHNEVRRFGLPGEVALIPMIESAYNPRSYSKAGAAGLWQIMPGTGSGLGLQINYWYDGRRDVVASTQAALSYFKKLNRIFSGDWLLSIAAYDSGEGTVQHARQMNAGLNRDLDFWSLSLPKETQKYVPKLLAVVEIITNPEQYQIDLPYIPNKPYFSNVHLANQMDLDAAAQLAQVKLDDLYRLNPGYNRWTTGPGPHTLLLPVAHAKILAANLVNQPFEQKTKFHLHKVKKGEKLKNIAEEYNVTPDELKKLNHLASNYVRAGTTIKIRQENNIENSLESRKKIIYAFQTENIGPHRVMHEVKSTDTIESIALRYQVKANAIRFWNHIRADQTIKMGNILTIWTSLPASKIMVSEKTEVEVVHHHKASPRHEKSRKHHHRYA